jgi:hypothetical protein
MTVAANRDYQLTFWYNATGFSTDVSASYTLTWYDGGGGTLSTVTAEITHAAQPLWTKVSRWVNAPANAATAKLNVTLSTAVTGIPFSFFSLDNVQCTPCSNVLLNGGFESGLANWTHTSGTGTVTADTASPKDGTYALKIVPSTTDTETSAAVAVTPGRDYWLSTQFKSSGSVISASYTVTWYDGGGAQIGSPVTTSYPTAAVTTWTAYPTTGPLRLPAPATAATAKVSFSASTADTTVWIDQVDFHPDPYLVLNSSFEGGLTTWTSSTSGSGTVSADTAQHQDGAQSLKLDVTSSIGSANATSTAVSVSGGRDFLLSFYYRSAGANNSAALAADVHWYNSGGTEITPAAHVALPNAAQGTWTNKTQRVSPPANTASLKVIYNLSTTTDGAYTLWIDQMTLDRDANLLPNGGIEGGLTGFNTSTSGTGASVSADTTQPYEDLNALKLDVPNPSSGATATMTNYIPVTAGKDYDLNVWFRSTGFSRTGNYDNVSASYHIYYYNSAYTQIGSRSIGLPYAAQATWLLRPTVFTPPATTAYVKMDFCISAGTGTLPSTLWLDHLEILPHNTRLKPGGNLWVFRPADTGNFSTTNFRRSADDHTLTGTAVVANPLFGTATGYISSGIYTTAPPAGLYRAVYRLKVGSLTPTYNVANLDVNTPNYSFASYNALTTANFTQANVYQNIILRFKKQDTNWVDPRANWQGAVFTALSTVIIYDEEVDQ